MIQGSAKTEWRKVTVGDICDVGRGSSPRPIADERFFIGGSIPWVKIADATKSGKYLYETKEKVNEYGASFSRLLPKESLIVAASGTLGYTQFLGVAGCVHDGWLYLKDFRDVNKHFLYYLFKWRQQHFYNMAYGASIQNVNTTILREMEIDLPPLRTQNKIAAVLSAYDDLIENNTRRIQILEEMAQALYREWFVNFSFPGHDKSSMVGSEVGPIPEGWHLKRLGDDVELAYGKALKSEDRTPGPYPVYGSSGIVGSHSEALVEGPGIIVGRKGNVGSVRWSDRKFYPIDTAYFVKTALPLEYVFFNLQRQNFLNNDAAVPGLNRNQAYSLPFLVPSIQLMADFTVHIKTNFEQTNVLRKTNLNLRQTRDLLLPRLISGEVDVADLDIKELKTA